MRVFEPLTFSLRFVRELQLCKVLCTLLEGDPPAETTTPPRRSAHFEATLDDAGLEQEQDGDGTKGNHAQAKTDRSSAPPLATEQIKGGNAVGVDGGDGGGGSAGEEECRGDEKPEKSRFNVLLGMLTIVTMVDAEGEAASSWAAKSSGGMGQDEHKNGDRSKSGKITSSSGFGAFVQT